MFSAQNDLKWQKMAQKEGKVPKWLEMAQIDTKNLGENVQKWKTCGRKLQSLEISGGQRMTGNDQNGPKNGWLWPKIVQNGPCQKKSKISTLCIPLLWVAILM